MHELSFQVENGAGAPTPLAFGVRRLIAAGFTGRDQAAALAHIKELQEHGVATPARLPALYPVPSQSLWTGADVDVLGESTSGEVEAVLFFAGERAYVGVGSDHTDREVEKIGIGLSKVVCPKIVGPTLWPLESVEDRWDQLVLRSWVSGDEGRTLYQEGTLRELMRPGDLVEQVRGRVRDRDLDGLVLFMGTLPTLGRKFVFASDFAGELHDPATGRTLRLEYAVHPFDWLAS